MFYQEHIVSLYQNLNIEDKLVMKEIIACMGKESKILNSKIIPAFNIIKDWVGRMWVEDLPVFWPEEYRFKGFIEEVQVIESDLKQ